MKRRGGTVFTLVEEGYYGALLRSFGKLLLLTTVITMASPKDTATFFTEGSSNQFEYVLSLYPEALRLKAEKKVKKPEELIKLDNW